MAVGLCSNPNGWLTPPNTRRSTILDDDHHVAMTMDDDDKDYHDSKRSSSSSSSGSSSSSSDVIIISPLCPLILKVMSQVTGITTLHPDTELSSLRVDSLGTTILAHKLSTTLKGMVVPVADFYRYDTINDLATHLCSRLCDESKPEVLQRLGLGHLLGGNSSQAFSDDDGGAKRVGGGDHGGATTNTKSSGSGTSTSTSKGIDRLLVGLRGVLILWVVTEHGVSMPKYKDMVLDRFYINTCLFLMLSGFTLYLSYLLSHGIISWSSYFKSRIIGLFPTYYLALVLYLPWYISLRLEPGAYYYEEYHHDPIKYVVDVVLYLIGLQALDDEVMHRGMFGVYYASIQWITYLCFPIYMAIITYVLSPCYTTLTSKWFPSSSSSSSGTTTSTSSATPYWLAIVLSMIFPNSMVFVVGTKDFLDNGVVMTTCFWLGMAAAGIYHHYTYGGDDGGHHQQKQQQLSSTSSSSSSSSPSGVVKVVVWRLSIVMLWGLFVWLVVDTIHVPDFTISRMVYPLLGVAILLLLTLQTFPSIIKNHILESPLFFIIGSASLPIYFVNNVIKDYYLPVIFGTFTPAGTFYYADSNNDFRQPTARPTTYVILEAIIVLVVGCLLQKYVIDRYLLPGAITAMEYITSSSSKSSSSSLGCCCSWWRAHSSGTPSNTPTEKAAGGE